MSEHSCVHGHTHMHICMHACGSQRLWWAIFLDDVPLRLLKQSLSFEPRDHRVGWPSQLACSREPRLCLLCAVGSRDPNAHPHASVAVALPTEPSSQSLSLLPQSSKCLHSKPVLPFG